MDRFYDAVYHRYLTWTTNLFDEEVRSAYVLTRRVPQGFDIAVPHNGSTQSVL
eukprot:CAMPEP_0194044604 /NCGR_PEP_ID=MMETSP0009_2-20130614/16054_1 /TAXON_ID=210454 /ORGANISM="Grammatophora oceanica, Strain CCMP 410" /LENGTH=52 /DNA_ID=CAMNT_0038689175 /DNA_START=66 /DNA_END=220 /DNA_ORIENTATION=-